MDNPVFVDEENIPMVHEDEDDDDSYKTPDTSRVETNSMAQAKSVER